MLNLRQTLILIVLFVGTSVSLITLDNSSVLDPVKSRMSAVVQPVTNAFRGVADGRQSDADAELAEIRAERDYYRNELARIEDIEEENNQLRSQLDIETRYTGYDVLSATVLNRDPANLQKTITINRGTDDGVQLGMAVVDPSNYVGQVTDVSPLTAQVTLFIDSSATVGARISGGGDGMLYGTWQSGGRAELRYVDLGANPERGARVVTADDGATQSLGVPGGLVIGEVGENIMTDPQRDELTVPIIPYCDFDNLKVVTVILGPDTDGSSSDTVPELPSETDPVTQDPQTEVPVAGAPDETTRREQDDPTASAPANEQPTNTEGTDG